MWSETQIVQEVQYVFPYHHLVSYGTEGCIGLTKHSAWALNYAGRMHLVATALNDIEFNSLVDIGCGDGKLISSLSDKYRDKKFLGIDHSMRAIDLAKALCRRDNVEFEVANINSLVNYGYYDVATLIEVIEHIPPSELNRFLCTVFRFIKCGSYLICSTPSTRLPVSRKHYQHFGLKQAERLLEAVGFHIIHADCIDGEGPVFRNFKRVFFNSLYHVNSSRMQNMVFRIYRKFCLERQGRKGNGIFIIARKATQEKTTDSGR